MGQHITKELRYHIYGLKRAGLSHAEIAADVGKHRTTIAREFKRNIGGNGWRPEQANNKAIARRKNSSVNNTRITPEHWQEVDRLVRQDFSPEQISGRLKQEQNLSISHEHIYQRIYADKARDGGLHKHLRCQQSYRKRYGSGQERRGAIKNRVSIDERPTIVDDKSRIGDWEGDTIIGKGHKGAVVTLIERKTLYSLAAPVAGKHADGVRDAIIELLKPHQSRCHTITFDNGKEFAYHERIAQSLEANIYFAHPYHSWERGCNENANGLLRQYLPKQKPLHDASVEKVLYATEKLNHRPRKSLGFKSPHEVFFGVNLRYTFDSTGGAIRS
jgi:IS30 family transposase